MKNIAIWGLAGCLLLCLPACDRVGPTSPLSSAHSIAETADADQASSLTVTSSRGAYFIGETEAFAASLTIDGQPAPVAGASWTTDTPNVATVSEAGLVTIVGEGFANISCASHGLTGSKQIWGRVDCRGAWSGTYTIRRCELRNIVSDSGFSETHGGSGLPIDLVLTQEGEVLQGTVRWNGFSSPFVAKPLLDGSLEMEGEVFSDPFTINIAIGCHWDGSEPKFDMMLYYYTGTNHLGGQAMLYCDLSLSKTGAGQ